MNEVFFGRFVRNMHYWSANLLVVVVLLHMLRVFFTDAFHAPRRFNWIIGLCLFGFVLVSNFTGYLLPWDQLAYWAVTICTGMMEYIPLAGTALQSFIRGGTEMGPATLSNFFVFHVVVMPVCFLLFLPFHFWRVRKDGGVVRPRTAGAEAPPVTRMVPVMPNLVIREAALGLVVTAVIFLLAATIDAPLGDSANPGLSPNPTKAPWYFMGPQELMLHFHPLFAVFIIPLVVVGLLVYLPYGRFDANMSGIWFRSAKGRRSALMAVVAALVVTPMAIVADEFYLDFESWLPGLSPAVSNGLLPVAAVASILAGGYMLVKKKYTDSNNEAVQALFVFLLVALTVLTAFGIWLRGEGMVLGW
jgi:quinol-cytochrome oxidoreductase complex cytochrome b subunit